MSYVFALSFLFRKYRSNARIRVYADDHLVEELTLEKDINIKTIRHNDLYGSKLIGPRNFFTINFIPEKVFLFEISEKYLKDHIRIEVQNSNNDYTNGFMNNFSYIMFTDFNATLVPKWMLEPKYWTKKSWERYARMSPLNEENYSYNIFPSTLNYTEKKYILVEPSHKSLYDVDWFGFPPNFRLGGSFSIKISLSKKHRLLHFGRRKPGRMTIGANVLKTLWRLQELNTSK